MVSNKLLFYVRLRWNVIFGSVNNEPFAGITVITVGDFFQLAQVGGKLVCSTYKNTWQNLESLWKHFKILS